MNIIKNKYFVIGIKKSGKGEKWHWKPTPVNTLHNYHKLKNDKSFKHVNTWSYYIPVLIQIFWFNKIIFIKLKPKLLSGNDPIKYKKL